MSAPDDRIDAFLSEELARHSRPRLAPGLASTVLERVAQGERQRRARPRMGARLLLAAYWLSAGLASAWILDQLTLPQWSASAGLGLAAALTPLAYAAALWPERARAWLLALLRPLAPPLER